MPTNMSTPEALRSVLTSPPTPPTVATNVQAMAAMPQLLQPQPAEVSLNVWQMMVAASRPDQQQAFIETLFARQQ